ncbi:single-strand selective monofunctional uracil dna glycosylase [Holotrichia oblita]|uniref:Single-strand selective monofunctional uracil dna glycosylase n=1 Tax=Holotrichia oblita TaxID=644536 RepID=A0ACB9TJY4_HOLOL|nr:single-strand selective monofunctional uracil dna glycosylase [Holotrichia oblita]
MLRKKLKLSSTEDAELSEIYDVPNMSLALSNKHFNSIEPEEIPAKLLKHANGLNEKLSNLSFNKPVEYIYNPVEYAFDMYEAFIRKFCNEEKKILLLGMNPGPWGMAQTGIPFGEIKMVKEWYRIEAKINKPAIECPDRPIMGLNCHRSEISGKRLYEFFKKVSDTPENFFKNTYLYNYCPLAFMMKQNGKNITPAQLKGSVKKELEEHCNDTLLQVLSTLNTEIIIALGKYVKDQAESILRAHNIDHIQVIYLLHPSPQIPGNQNWGTKAQKSYPKKMHSSSNNVLNPNELSESEKHYMEIAFTYARDALRNQEVPVGCIFVYNNEIIAKGRNTVNETRNATRHAEMNCIDDVIAYCDEKSIESKDVFENVSIYVTVEPCIMCAAALYNLKIKQILFGCRNDRFGGQTVFDVSTVLNPVTDVKGGYRADEAMALLKEFYKGTNPSAPPSKVKIKSIDTKLV